MAKLIQIGVYNKKLFLPFGVAFVQILINIMNKTLPEKIKNHTLEMTDLSLSEIFVVIIPIFNICSLNTRNDFSPKRTKKKIALQFLVLSFIFGVFIAFNIMKSIQANNFNQQHKSYQNPHNSGLSSLESLELIFITIVSILLLKYKYFIHHIISIIVFIFICFFIDLILHNYEDLFERGGLFIFLNIMVVLVDAIGYGYQKYMMDVLFHPYWSVSLAIGLTSFTINSGLLIACLSKGKEQAIKEKNQMFIGFYKYFEEVDLGIIIIKHLLNFILSFFLNLFRSLTILHFSPDYILISFTISRILDIILETGAYECLVLFALQFITLMFYLEIFEFNFWGLNKNTRKNIQKREKEEMLLQEKNSRSSSTSEIEISPDYIVYDEHRNSTKDIRTQSGDSYNHIYELSEKYDS